ncbi:DUF6471 domain-containing protein [Burkholderia sp. AU39826]|uniref:DUF6471 domain-containing protein n=1 Tax=Burkholderia sp. AU39826 TaxID=2879634 RepID=UPI001CF2959D|nr:DUF6471 domain-containing protein [Burkholderia sp. AU39826]MCA7970747.1 DUF6471 domain-containing protein [Burkholderia sp. AU39826]
MTRTLVSEEDAVWGGLASRVIRVALERKGLTYAGLAEELTAIGVRETERALISRLARGTAKLTLLLQIIHVTEALAPRLWLGPLALRGTWEERAQAVIMAELGQRPWVTPDRLVALLGDIGVATTEELLASQFSTGTIPLSLFLQCAVVLGSCSLHSYIDFADLAAAVDMGGRPQKPE